MSTEREVQLREWAVVGCGSEERGESRTQLGLGTEDWRRPRVCFFAYLCLGEMVHIK